MVGMKWNFEMELVLMLGMVEMLMGRLSPTL
jgi:hypothetical protein